MHATRFDAIGGAKALKDAIVSQIESAPTRFGFEVVELACRTATTRDGIDNRRNVVFKQFVVVERLTVKTPCGAVVTV